MENSKEKNGGYLSLLGAWALAFGCAVGWETFVLPWTVMLPQGGPLGTAIGIVVGCAIMLVIAWNFGFMIRRHPGPGGPYTFMTKAFGVDRGFLCAWFLTLTYMSIVWLNATVLAYFLQHATPFDFNKGFTYVVGDYGISIVHIIVSSIVMTIAALLCCRRRLAIRVQIVIAAILAACIVLCVGAAMWRHEGGFRTMAPAFAPANGHPLAQIIGLIAYAPWLFVGFESISHVSGEFAFPRKKTFFVLASALVAAAAAYLLASLVPALVPWIETGFHTWPGAVGHMASPNNTAFGTIGRSFLHGGRIVVAITFFVAVFTNLIGNTVAASRLLAAMADDGSMPKWFGRRNSDGTPSNAIAAIACLAIFVFSLGEIVIGIVTDVAMLGAALAYAYTSAATFKIARREGNRFAQATGLAGAVFAAGVGIFSLLPNFSSHIASMATESYLVVVCWCIAGLLTFLILFRRDKSNRFGQSPVVWITFFVTILVLSIFWIRQSTFANTSKTFDELIALHEEVCADDTDLDILRDAIRDHQASMTKSILRDGFVQSLLTVFALALMLNLFFIARRRERAMEKDKIKAKSYFFSTVSHDIRTPLNAIIGFSEMLKDGSQTEEEREQAVDSILVSGKTLLALINDVLDLSKLESGKMDILPEPTDCQRLLRGVMDAFRVASGSPEVELRCRVGDMPLLMLDPQRLRQIAFNLLGNAVKFTERGHIELRATFSRDVGAEKGTFRLEVEDTGCGISEENLKRIASPYVQVGSKIARNGGTGLGLAICQQLANAMGGKLDVASTLGKGSVFSVTIPGVATALFEVVTDDGKRDSGAGIREPGFGGRDSGSGSRDSGSGSRDSGAADSLRSGGNGGAQAPRRILLVDDLKMNLVLLKTLLKKTGDFDISMAADGCEALKMLKGAGDARFDLVLTDMWMPNLDGEGLVKAIRAEPSLASLRVVAVTADVEIKGKFAKMGFDDILLKPITNATLDKVLRGGA